MRDAPSRVLKLMTYCFHQKLLFEALLHPGAAALRQRFSNRHTGGYIRLKPCASSKRLAILRSCAKCEGTCPLHFAAADQQK